MYVVTDRLDIFYGRRIDLCYIANSPFTKATGTYGAGAIQSKMKKKFHVEVMFITSSKVICKVVDGFKDKKKKDIGEMILTPPTVQEDN